MTTDPPDRGGRAGRVFALAIALIASAGLAVQLHATAQQTGSVGAAAWVILRFFTILANLGVAVVFGLLAAGRLPDRSPRLVGGTMLSIVLVGAVYQLLLRGIPVAAGHAWLANLLLHAATPVLVPIYWLACTPHGWLRPRDAVIWAVWPLAYLGYALARGAADGVYPYPFIDVGRLGLARALGNAAGLAGCFVAAGLLAWAADRILGRRGAIQPAGARATRR